MGFDPPGDGAVLTPSPGEANHTYLRNREPGPESGLWNLHCANADRSAEEEGDGILQGCLA